MRPISFKGESRVIFEAIQFPNIDPAALTHAGRSFGARPVSSALVCAGLHCRPGARLALDGVADPPRQALDAGQASAERRRPTTFCSGPRSASSSADASAMCCFYKPDMIWKSAARDPPDLARRHELPRRLDRRGAGRVLVHPPDCTSTRRNSRRLRARNAPSPRRRRIRGAITSASSDIGWVKKTEAEELRAESAHRQDRSAAPRRSRRRRRADRAVLWPHRQLHQWRTLGPRHRRAVGRGVLQRAPCRTALRPLPRRRRKPRHPSQLYEAALEGIALFAIINIATLRFDSLRRPGMNVGLFLVCYGLFRALLEFVREPDAHMPEALRGYVTMGMLLSSADDPGRRLADPPRLCQPKLAAA